MSSPLPKWLANWIGAGSAVPAEAAAWQLESSWPLPPWATVLLVIAAIWFIVFLYLREGTAAAWRDTVLLISLRISAVAIVLIMLAQWAITLQITGLPALALVIDRSASMGIADRDAVNELSTALRERLIAAGLSEPTRLDLAKWIVTENESRLLRELFARFRVEVYGAANSVERLSDASTAAATSHAVRKLTSDGPDSNATRLGDAVRNVLADSGGAPLTAMVLLTDGITTAGMPLAAAAQEARAAGVPLYTVGLGSDRPQPDLELVDVVADELAFVGDALTFHAQIKATGLAGQQAKLALRADDDSLPLIEEQVRLPPDGQILTVPLSTRVAKTGKLSFIVELPARNEERDTRNNRRNLDVTVVDQKIRVLLVNGYPSYEYRFMKTLFERDQTVQLATYLQDADPDYAEQDKTALRSFPIGREDLLEYDVLILGDTDPRRLPASVWQNVRALAAEKGGGVALLAGPRYLPWQYREIPDILALLPFDFAARFLPGNRPLPLDVQRGFSVRPTQLGLQNPVLQLGDSASQTEQIWQRFSPLYWLTPIDELKPGAQVLAVGANQPVIVFQFAGSGRVWFHAIDSTWRWRLGVADTYFARYWSQAVRFLARGRLNNSRTVQLTTDRREYLRGEPVMLRARFSDPGFAPGEEVTVVIEPPGEARRHVKLRRHSGVPGVFEATISNLPEGQHEVLLVDPQHAEGLAATRFSVVEPPGEMARTHMDAAALRKAAQLTGGQFYTVSDVERLLSDLPTGRRVPIENLPPISLWNRWWMLAAFLAVLSAEWILRKRKGML